MPLRFKINFLLTNLQLIGIVLDVFEIEYVLREWLSW